MLTGQCVDQSWLACLLPASLILVSQTMAQDRPANVLISDRGPTAAAGRQCQYRPMLASQSSASIIIILVKPWHKTAGLCFALCWTDCLLPVCLILVQPRPKIAGFSASIFFNFFYLGPTSTQDFHTLNVWRMPAAAF